MNKILVVIVGVILLLGVMLFGTYNSLVTQTTAIDGQWAQVEVQYQRRFDLIPNLVSATKGYLTQEKSIFEDIAKARAAYSGANTVDAKVTGAQGLDSALSRLLVIMENYPVLKSDQTVARLTDELAGTENRISVERRRFNELVQVYDTRIKTVPTNIVAGMFGFKERAYFQITSGADVVPKVTL